MQIDLETTVAPKPQIVAAIADPGTVNAIPVPSGLQVSFRVFLGAL